MLLKCKRAENKKGVKHIVHQMAEKFCEFILSSKENNNILFMFYLKDH